MNRYRKNLGDWGEDLAIRFLQKRGYTIVEQNFSSRYGEIDIIAMHPKETDTICCIEVKTRISTQFGEPEQAITSNKIKRLHDTACSYFFQNRIEDKIFRLDVISIFVNKTSRRAKIRHIKAISYQDL